jgi:protein-S-isoprenylcysteine O-methyltransferase Ste14
MSPGVGLGVFFGLGWAVFYVFRPEGIRAAFPFYTPAERLWVQFAPAILSLHVTAACISITRTTVISPLPGVLAVATFVMAIGFWFWGRTMIGPLRVRRLPQQPPLRFRCDGAFGIVRHPLYFGYLLAASAPLLVVCRVFLLVTLALSFSALAVRAVQEERHLRAQIGPRYAAYCRDVKRLIPFVW